MEQGRRAIRHAFGIPGPILDTEFLPFAVYSIPEVSYIGETEETLQAKGVDYVGGRGRYDMNPRGQIIGDTGGMLKLLFDAGTLRLLGVHIVGTSASASSSTSARRSSAPSRRRCRSPRRPYNYPTLSDLYRHAALKALSEHRRKQA